ncbi:MAG: hypothetical protein AAB933_01870 [Patescibacteria group bacterium]
MKSFFDEVIDFLQEKDDEDELLNEALELKKSRESGQDRDREWNQDSILRSKLENKFWWP